MSKYGPVIEKQLDFFITFMEAHLIHRKFTPTESANMRQVLYTIVHTAQLEVVGVVGNNLKNIFNKPSVPVQKFEALLKSLKALSQPPPF